MMCVICGDTTDQISLCQFCAEESGVDYNRLINRDNQIEVDYREEQERDIYKLDILS